jgi:hypothetical protein
VGDRPVDRNKPTPQVSLGVSFSMLPTFEEKVLERRDGHVIFQDWMGATVEISDAYDLGHLRRQYGRQMACIGSIVTRALAAEGGRLCPGLRPRRPA